MKKTIQTFFLTALVAVTSAQTNKWSNTGDNFTGNNWLGTTGNEPLVLKANNTTGLKIKTNGELIIKSLDLNNTTNGLILTDGQGKVSRLDFSGNASQILLGNGTWATMPAALTMLTVNGLNMSTQKSSKMGIGVANPIAELDVDGNTNIRGSLTVKDGLNFDAINGISYQAATATAPSIFSFGAKTSQGTLPVSCYFANIAGTTTQGSILMDVNGFINLHNATNTNQLILGYDGANSIIETGSTNGTGALLINYYCGKDIAMNTGVNGGAVYLGRKVHAAQSLKIGYDGTTTNIIDPNTPLAVYYNGTGGDAFTITNASTNKINFKVKSDGVVYSRELNVQLTAFPDYVFKKEYKLMSLEQLDTYIKANHHLPNMPTAAVIEKEGANLGELSKLQMEKIEELTLYVIELKKELDALKKTVNKN